MDFSCLKTDLGLYRGADSRLCVYEKFTKWEFETYRKGAPENVHKGQETELMGTYHTE